MAWPLKICRFQASRCSQLHNSKPNACHTLKFHGGFAQDQVACSLPRHGLDLEGEQKFINEIMFTAMLLSYAMDCLNAGL